MVNQRILVIILLTTAFPCICTGFFIFNNIQLELNKDVSCHGTAYLLWNYTTDETVTVIEWYKQPGVLIARIFGVNIGAPLTVLSPYNDTTMYNVTRYNPSEYNAAINITGMTSTDNGVYSVNVTAASPQSSTLNRTFLNATDQACLETNDKSGAAGAGEGNIYLLSSLLFMFKVLVNT